MSKGLSRIQADLLLLLCAAIWGFAFLCQKRAMAHMGPLTFIALRSVLAVLTLWPLVLRERHRSPESCGSERAVVKSGLWAGLAFFAGSVLQQSGLVTATVTNTGFLTSLYVVITPFCAWWMLGEKPVVIIWLAALLSILGALWMGGGSLTGFSHGDLLVAFSALFWAIYMIRVRKGAAHGRACLFTLIQFATLTMLGGIGAALFETWNTEGIRRALPDVAFMGVISSALIFSVLTVAMRATRPAEASILLSTESLFAALAAYLILGERLHGGGWAGAALILAATLMVQWAPKRVDG